MSAGVVIIGGIIAAFAISYRRGNLPYSLVFLWALAGIYAAGGQKEGVVAYAAAISAILVIIAAVVGISTSRRSR